MHSLTRHQEDRLSRLLDAWCEARGIDPDCAFSLWAEMGDGPEREWLSRFIEAWDRCGTSKNDPWYPVECTDKVLSPDRF